MKKSIFLWNVVAFMMALTLSLSTTSCCSDDDDKKTEPTPSPTPASTLSVSPSELPLSANAGATGTLSINCTSNWEISCNESWIQFTPNTGTGAGAVTVSANTENPNNSERKATITIKSEGDTKYVTVTQAAPVQIKINGATTANLMFEGDFAGKSGIDYKQTVTVTSTIEWKMRKSADWISVSPTNGSGTVSMDIYPTSECLSSESRTATITLEGSGVSATIEVTQSGGRAKDCYANPQNVLSFVHDVACNFECGSKTKFFYVACFKTDALPRLTDKEIATAVANDNNSQRRTYSEASGAICFRRALEPNTSYTIVSVSYSNSDELGDVIKYEVKTKPTVNQPTVEIVDVGIGSKGNTDVYGISAKKGQNGYCEKYYVWGCAGSSLSSLYIEPSVICWYLNQEIKTSPISHTTYLSRYFDQMTEITTVGREYLHGPLSQEESISSDLVFSRDDKNLLVIAWGIDLNGNLSGYYTYKTYNVTSGGSNAPMKISKPAYSNSLNGKGYSVLPKP